MTRRDFVLASTLVLVLGAAGAPRLAHGAGQEAARPPAPGGGICAPGTVMDTPAVLLADAPAFRRAPRDRHALGRRVVHPCIAPAGKPAADAKARARREP